MYQNVPQTSGLRLKIQGSYPLTVLVSRVGSCNYDSPLMSLPVALFNCGEICVVILYLHVHI